MVLIYPYRRQSSAKSLRVDLTETGKSMWQRKANGAHYGSLRYSGIHSYRLE